MTRKQRSTRSKVFIVLLTVGLTLLAVIVAANFSEAEKTVERRIERLYSVHDSAFIRAMSLALGPSVVGGNHVETLLNGDEIFPSMLSAIAGATRTVTMETSSTGAVRSGADSRKHSPGAPAPGSRYTCWWTGSAAARWTMAMWSS